MERSISPHVLSLAGKRLIDVRRSADRDVSDECVPGAVWHDPEQMAAWAGALPTDQAVILHCVRGGSVLNSVVDALRARGLDEGFIEGGIEGWNAAGGEVTGK